MIGLKLKCVYTDGSIRQYIGSVVSRVFTNECDGVGATAAGRTLREIFVRAQVVAAMLHT